MQKDIIPKEKPYQRLNQRLNNLINLPGFSERECQKKKILIL